MNKFGYYISSMRLRTLPLALGGVLLGALLALADYRVDPRVILLLCLTAVLLQILSNLSNELGDVLRGNDGKDRQGPLYGLNSGALSVKQMKRFIAVIIILCCISGAAMARLSFGTLLCIESITLLLLGAAAIIAAMRYTLGRNPYGYRGFGDFYVFMFFGIVSVLGAYFISAHTLNSWALLLPASAMGLLSTAVLNLNNIRDMDTDAPLRGTTAIRFGLRGARIYHALLISAGVLCTAVYVLLRFPDIRHWLFLLTLPFFALHIRGVFSHTGRALDRYFPGLVLSIFALAILTGVGFVMYLL